MEELDIHLESKPIVAKTRKLKARWTIEYEIDMFFTYTKPNIRRKDDYFELFVKDDLTKVFKVIKVNNVYMWNDCRIENEKILEALKSFERKEKLSKLLSE